MRSEMKRFLHHFEDSAADVVLPPRPTLEMYEEAAASTLLLLGMMRDKVLFGARKPAGPAKYHIVKQ